MIASVGCVISWMIVIFICIRGEKIRDEYEEVCLEKPKRKK